MKKLVFAVSALVLCLAVWESSAAPKSSKPSAAQIARGKYIVEGIGMCGDCHTPMDEKGQPVRAEWLEGAPLMFKPEAPVPGWTSLAPPIAGLPTYTEEQAVHFLMTGETPAGSPANPPMPQFRLNRDDARAVVAYLKSLKK